MKSFELKVKIGNKVIPHYQHEGLIFVEGRKGSEFTLEFKNNTHRRVLAIPSVDSLSIMDGKPATPDSTGYIVDGYSTLEIKGWRIDDSNISSFKFCESGDSYGQSVLGSSHKTGVIGLMVYSEKIKYSYRSPHWEKHVFGLQPGITCSTSNIRGMSLTGGSDPDETLGTGWGSHQVDQVSRTTFDRDQILETIAIYYDSKKNLEARGIDLKPKPTPINELPKPFFTGCVPPVGWKG